MKQDGEGGETPILPQIESSVGLITERGSENDDSWAKGSGYSCFSVVGGEWNNIPTSVILISLGKFLEEEVDLSSWKPNLKVVGFVNGICMDDQYLLQAPH